MHTADKERNYLDDLFLSFLDEALRSSPAAEGCRSILWRACEFSHSYTAWGWPRWEICYVRWLLFQLCYLFCILEFRRFWFSHLTQVERIAAYGYGVSKLENCFLRISSVIQFSPLCAIKNVQVVTTICFWLSFLSGSVWYRVKMGEKILRIRFMSKIV